MSDGFVFVDTHVHFWDLSNHPDRYPALMAMEPDEGHDVGLGDMAGMRRDYLPATYAADVASAGITVPKIVHVSATTLPRAYLDEITWVESLAAAHGVPTGFIGSIDPGTSPAEVTADLAAQGRSALFRGARVLFDFDPESAATGALLDYLAAGDHVFDLVSHPAEVDGLVALIDRNPSLRVVVEHCAWPDGPGDDNHAVWKTGLAALAARENVHCKISGVPMFLGEIGAAAFRPWVETIVETFGAHRCVVGSNFPVDSLSGTYAELIAAYREVLGSASAAEQRAIWVENAERIYKI